MPTPATAHPFSLAALTIATMPAADRLGKLGPCIDDGGQIGVGFTGVGGQMVGNGL